MPEEVKAGVKPEVKSGGKSVGGRNAYFTIFVLIVLAIIAFVAFMTWRDIKAKRSWQDVLPPASNSFTLPIVPPPKVAGLTQPKLKGAAK